MRAFLILSTFLYTAYANAQLSSLKKAYFASGCFWCVEAIFESLEGVEYAVSGYSGGKKQTANYKAVSKGITQHAESVAVSYDPKKISYATLVDVFFASHNPSSLNQQGPDKGYQYRSAIFYTNAWQKDIILKKIETLKKSKKITTTVSLLKAFYPAEQYHQDFEKRNPDHPYVKAVSKVRLLEFQKKHKALLKKGIIVH